MQENLRRQVLELLQANSRHTEAQIAAMLGVPEADVAAAIAALEQEGILRKYTAVVDWDRYEQERVTALIEVRLHPQREVGFDRVAERIYRYPEVASCFLVSGTYDLLVVVEGRDLKEIARFVAERLATLEHVTGTTTHFLLKRYKQDGVLFADGGDEDRRLVVAP